MAVRFSADEVLSIAETIERNGTAFYEGAAGKVKAQACRKLLLDLAQRERDHEKTFSAMRKSLSEREREPTAFDPEGELAMYLKVLADETVFQPGQDPLTTLGANPAYRDILRTAIKLEKESIVFYVGMKEMVPADLGRSRVDAILREEMSHVATLTRELAQAAK